MILDRRTELSDSQVVTSSAITANVIDLRATPILKDIASGKQLYMVFQVDVAATAAGAATMTFSIESDSTENLATSPTVHSDTAAIPRTALVAGYTIALPLPYGVTYERYLGGRYTVATGPLTAGAFSCFITDAPQNWYPVQAGS